MNFVVLKDVTIEPVFDLLFQAIESIVLARLIRYNVSRTELNETY